MKKTIIITSVRPNLMKRFLDSFYKMNMQKEWKIGLMTQKYSNEDIDILKEVDINNRINFISVDKRIPPYIAKSILLEENISDMYCSLDDDCVLLDTMDYETPEQFVMHNNTTGIVSCNWIRFNTPAMMSKKRIENKYVKQNLVFTGGGMLFSNKIAEIIRSKPKINWLFDDVQFSIDSYVSGFINYRYMGSVIEHNIVTKGGILTLYNEQNMTINDSKYIVLEKSKKENIYDNSYYIPRDKNLTQYSHNLHNENLQKNKRI